VYMTDAAPLTLLLFDLDGTLLMAHGAGREAKVRAMREIFGTDADVMTYPFGGKTDWQILVEVLGPHGYDRAAIGALMASYEARFAVHMAEVIRTNPAQPLLGAMELIATLRQQTDVLLGVVTGNTSSTAPIKLRAAGFDPAWFPVGAFGSESDDRRDLPRLALERAIAHAGRDIPAQSVIVIGDTVNDIVAARANGMRAVGVLNGFEEAELLRAAAPDVLLEDLTQFLEQVPLRVS